MKPPGRTRPGRSRRSECALGETRVGSKRRESTGRWCRKTKASWRGGRRPSGWAGRNVGHGVFSSSAHSRFWWKKQSSQRGFFAARRGEEPVSRVASVIRRGGIVRHRVGLVYENTCSLRANRLNFDPEAGIARSQLRHLVDNRDASSRAQIVEGRASLAGAPRPVGDGGRRGGVHDDLSVRPGTVDRHDPAIHRPRPPRRSGHLRPAGGLGGAIRLRPAACTTPDRGPHGRQSRDRERGQRSRGRGAPASGGSRRSRVLHPQRWSRSHSAPRSGSESWYLSRCAAWPRVRLRTMLACAGVGALAIAASVALLLPPREPIENPDYYANGSQIPVALRVTQQATDSAQALSQDLDEQLLGLAQLISIPRGAPHHGAPSPLRPGIGPAQQPACPARARARGCRRAALLRR